MIFHIFLIFLSQNKHIFSLYYYCKQQMQLLNISFSFSYFLPGARTAPGLLYYSLLFTFDLIFTI